MTVIPFTQAARLLAADAKTLRQWVKQAHLCVHAHPEDARIKCLTMEQVQQLATLHHRCIQENAATISEQISVVQDFVKPTGEQMESLTIPASRPLPCSCLSCCDLVKSHLALQASVTALQHQVAELALALLQERTVSDAHRLQTPEALIQSMQGQHVMPQGLKPLGEPCRQNDAASPEGNQSPTQRRARPSLLPLIEYGAAGTYVVISPEQGELFLTPDSADWFDWLSTLSSFRFLGRLGRLSTYRNKGRSSWIAYRRIHCHRYDHTLGTTHDLTIDRLEEMAAHLQSYVPSL